MFPTTDSNLIISPKMSYSVLECDIMLYNYMLMIFVIKKGHYLCLTLYLFAQTSRSSSNVTPFLKLSLAPTSGGHLFLSLNYCLHFVSQLYVYRSHLPTSL